MHDLYRRLEQANDEAYIGESISQLQHGLQAAALARAAGAPREEILAALFHDIGHLLPHSEKMDDLGAVNHEGLGALALRDWGMSDTVARLVRGHVTAKRYLATAKENYWDKLSPASRRTLEFQGGQLTPEEVREFEEDPLFEACLRIRAWDDQAKVVDLEVPGLESYRELIEEELGSGS